MPTRTAELVDLLALEQIEIGLFRGRQPETVLQRTFGGQVLAQAIMAAYATVEPDRRLHSMNAFFLHAGHTDYPIIYDCAKMRDGNSFSTRRVVARQGGRPIFELVCSFHIDEPGLDHFDPFPGDVPDPNDCPRLVEVMAKRFKTAASWFREWDALDVRYAGDSVTSQTIGREHGATMRIWMKTQDPVFDSPRLHQALAAYMSDLTLLSVSTIPHQVMFLSQQMQSASIDHVMWFHRPFRADRWILFDQVSPSASQALGLSSGRLFQDGVMVGACAQEGLIRVVDPDSTRGRSMRH